MSWFDCITHVTHVLPGERLERLVRVLPVLRPQLKDRVLQAGGGHGGDHVAVRVRVGLLGGAQVLRVPDAGLLLLLLPVQVVHGPDGVEEAVVEVEVVVEEVAATAAVEEAVEIVFPAFGPVSVATTTKFLVLYCT